MNYKFRTWKDRLRMNEELSVMETILSQLDETVNTLIEYDRIRGKSGAIAVREGQQEQRDDILSSIQSSIKRIDEISEELLPLQKERMELEVEVEQ